MALVSKQALLYNDYSWTAIAGDNPKVTGEPDSTLLNRKEGYEILYFINKFALIHNLSSSMEGRKIEQMIRLVPSYIHSQKGIYDWIVSNWGNH